MAKNKNKAKPKANRYNAEMAEDTGALNANTKNANSNSNVQTNK